MKKLLIPALLMLLIRVPLAWAGDNFFHDVIANAPLLTSPALPGDGIGVARAGAIYRLPVAGRGMVTITRPLSGALNATIPWLVTRPDFQTQNCAGTSSSCFNEAEADAFAQGWSVHVIGCGEYLGEGSSSPLCGISANSSAGFVLKPLANRMVLFDGVQFHCQGAANQGCMNVDSMMKGRIVCNGCEVISSPTTATTATCGWSLAPTSQIPNEAQIVITDSHIDLGNVAIQPGSGTARAAVCFNVNGGNIAVNKHIGIIEPNGGGSNNTAKAFADIAVFGADTGLGSFAGNIIEVGHPHSAQTAAILIGENTTNATRYAGNQWRVGYCDPSFTGAHCIDTFGTKDKFTVGLLNTASGPYAAMFFAQTSAVQNTAEFLSASGASSASGLNPGITDNAGWQNSYYVNGKPFSVQAENGQVLSGLKPTVVSGSGASVSADSVAYRGVITAGTGSPTTATLTLPITLPFAYRGCQASSTRAASNPATTTTNNTTTVTFTLAGAATGGDLIGYNCW